MGLKVNKKDMQEPIEGHKKELSIKERTASEAAAREIAKEISSERERLCS